MAVLMIVSVFGGTVAFSGAAAAATNTSVSAGSQAAGGTGVTYTLAGDVESASDSDYLTIDLGPANVNNVGDNDVSVNNQGGGSATSSSVSVDSSGVLSVELGSTLGSITVGDRIVVTVNNVDNPAVGGTYSGSVDLETTTEGDDFDTISGSYTINPSSSITKKKDSDPTERQNNRYDETLSSGNTYWQGQRLVLKKTSLANSQVDLRETETADGGGERIPSGSLVREISLDGNGEAVIKTANLEGTYAITDGQGNNAVIHFDDDGTAGNSDYSALGGDEFDGNGVVDSTNVASGEINDVVQAASFAVTSQNVNIGFQSDEAAQEEIYLEADSARTGYNLLVEADGLDDSEVVEIFNDEFEDGDDDNSVNNIEDASTQAGVSGDGVEFQGVNSDANITANFSGVDTGDYEFSFEVTDTGVTDTSTVSVTEEDDINAEILRGGVATAAQGDYAVLPIRLEETDEATVNLGFNNVNFNATFDIEDGDDDGLVTVNVNTYLAGRNDDLPSYLNSFVQTSGNTNFNSLPSSTAAERNARANLSLTYAVSADDNEDEVTVDGMRPLGQNGDLPDAGIDGPMEPSQYDVNVTSTNGDELDVGTVQIVEPKISGITSWTMPSSVFSDVDEDEPAEVYEYVQNGELTESNSVAKKDVLVYQIQSTSMFGALKLVEDQTSDDFAEALDTISEYGENGDYKFSVEQTESSTPANLAEKELVLSDSTNNGMKVVPDERNSSLFVVLKTDNTRLVREDLSGDDYSGTATKKMNDGEAYVANWTTFEDSDIGDDTQTVTDRASIVEKSIDFDTDAGGVIRVAAAAGQTISGSTAVAPGTELNIRLRSTGDSPFLEDPEAVVNTNGTFSTEVDLSDRAQNASFVANAQGFDDDYDTPGVIGSAPTASITFDDQEVSDGTVEVSGTMSEGGFVAIHSGSASGEVIGNSEYISPGEFTTQVEISPLSGETTLVAMAHMDTNDNQAYDFGGSGSADGPYTTSNDTAVIDSASISPETTDTPTTEEPTEEPTEMPTEEPTEMPTEDESGGEGTEEATTTETGPGFTAVLALVALVAAALLAVRRRD